MRDTPARRRRRAPSPPGAAAAGAGRWERFARTPDVIVAALLGLLFLLGLVVLALWTAPDEAPEVSRAPRPPGIEAQA